MAKAIIAAQLVCSIFFLKQVLNFIFKLYNIVLVLPNIEMNLPQVYPCSPSWTLLPPPFHFLTAFIEQKFLFLMVSIFTIDYSSCLCPLISLAFFYSFQCAGLIFLLKDFFLIISYFWMEYWYNFFIFLVHF